MSNLRTKQIYNTLTLTYPNTYGSGLPWYVSNRQKYTVCKNTSEQDKYYRTLIEYNRMHRAMYSLVWDSNDFWKYVLQLGHPHADHLFYNCILKISENFFPKK